MRLLCKFLSFELSAEKNNEIFRMNHKYDIDWLAGWIICQRLGIMQVISTKILIFSILFDIN
jgi:hypothetical protein